MENMIWVYFDGITKEYGCCIKNARVYVQEDYTMNQIVTAIKANGYSHFLLSGMKRFAKVP